MLITRNIPAEQLAYRTRAYRRAIWGRIALSVPLLMMLGYNILELFKSI